MDRQTDGRIEGQLELLLEPKIFCLVRLRQSPSNRRVEPESRSYRWEPVPMV